MNNPIHQQSLVLWRAARLAARPVHRMPSLDPSHGGISPGRAASPFGVTVGQSAIRKATAGRMREALRAGQAVAASEASTLPPSGTRRADGGPVQHPVLSRCGGVP
jgi:hypothetical protein